MDKNNWTYKKLGEVATFSRGLTYSKKDVAEDSSKKVLRSNNIDLDTHSLNYNEIAYLKEDFTIPEDKILHKNDIFICMSNGSTKHLGKVAFIDKEMDYAFGGFMGAIHPKTNEIFPKYAFYNCLSSKYRRFLASVLNGININNLKWSELSKFYIPIPPLAEQERIVAELDLLSSIIEKKKAQLKELDQLAQSIFYDMFGDPITNEKGWETSSLSTLCSITSSKRIFADEYIEKGIPFYRSKEVIEKSKGKKLSTELFISEKRYQEIKSKYGVPSIGDILITAVGTIGEVWVVDTTEPFYFKDGNLLWLKIKGDTNPQYFRFLLLILIDEYKKKMANGAAYAALTIVNLNKMSTNIIPLPLQQEFADKVEAIERQKTLIQQSIDEVQTLFDSRMDYWFG